MFVPADRKISVPSSAKALAVCPSAVFCLNNPFLSLLLNPPAEPDTVSSSSSLREQNVALGIKLFNYSVSYRLANITLSLLAPWTHQWYVCLHIWVCAAFVGPGVSDWRSVALRERSLWENGTGRRRPRSQFAFTQLWLLFMHAVVGLSHINRCHSHWGTSVLDFIGTKAAFFFLSMY